VKKLIEFDSNVTFGPAIGMKRLDRYNRAIELGIDPSPSEDVLKILLANASILGMEEYSYMEQYFNIK
jgi:hypothetical protein